MRRVVIGIAGFLIVSLGHGPADAYFHAQGNRSSWSAQGSRGTASGGDGSWSASGYRGGSASGGDGSWNATGYRGGTASGGGGSWQAHGASGGSAYGGYDHYYGGSYSTYHPPTVVNTYGSGCYNCGGWAAAGAVAAGAAIGAASATAASQNAYAAGYAAGSMYSVGAIYATLPGACEYRPIIGAYDCSGTWFQSAYGAGGVYYRVIPAP